MSSHTPQQPVPTKRRISVTILLFIVILLGVTSPLLMGRYLPDRLNPFAPLHIDKAPNFLTEFKIARLRINNNACFDVLIEADLEYQRLEDRTTGEGCGFVGAAMLKQSTVSYGGDIRLKCPALVSLMIWERHDLQPLAREILGQQVNRVRHYGTYACRSINGAKSGRRSQHAKANAIDIAGFRLDDGTEITVLEHWGQDSPRGRFLKAVHKAACSRFTTVLGPEYNVLHRDHFHFDHARFGFCR